MDIAIGLPSAVRGTTGAQLTEWARRADRHGFSSLGTIDRIAYDNYEPLVALSAAAAVTESIGLATSVLLGPLRGNAVALAKQALSLQALSGGRFTLGIGLGGREDDYALAGVELGERRARIEAMLTRIKEVWESGEVGPQVRAPRLLVGGGVEASFERAARHGEGWMAGGSPPEQFGPMREKVEAAWKAAGREGKPWTSGLAYFSLGADAAEAADAYLGDYYAWLGEETAAYVVSAAAKDAETVRRHADAFAAAGCDELFFFPSSPDPDQVDLLADALGL
jgi:alkanesulfonate monooxygenase SsuD/methylene tetrahydromethanopterin reductase-like flavin-dependent oxidoreductase (luciferase family)